MHYALSERKIPTSWLSLHNQLNLISTNLDKKFQLFNAYKWRQLYYSYNILLNFQRTRIKRTTLNYYYTEIVFLRRSIAYCAKREKQSKNWLQSLLHASCLKVPLSLKAKAVILVPCLSSPLRYCSLVRRYTPRGTGGSVTHYPAQPG